MVSANHAHPGRRQGTPVILRYDERAPHKPGTAQKRRLLGGQGPTFQPVSSTSMNRLGQKTLATFIILAWARTRQSQSNRAAFSETPQAIQNGRPSPLEFGEVFCGADSRRSEISAIDQIKVSEIASRPFCVFTTFIATRCPSSSPRSPARSTMETCTNTSF
jgi:hypothetical protein